MKKYKISSLLGLLMLAAIVMSFFGSCSNDDNASASGSLEVVSVSKAMSSSTPVKPEDNDSITAVGYPGMTYIIKGSGFASLKHVYFNDKESYFNPTMVTDNTIFVSINSDTPYENGSSELKLVTDAGTIVYPFVIGPPAPVIYGFDSVNAVEGDIITIKGNFFLSPSVTFGTTTVVPESSTLEEIKVKVPAGADKKYVKVTNITGFATSKEAIGTALYDDKLYGMQWGGPWAGKGVNFDFEGDSYQGEKSWQWVFGGWDGGNWGFNIDMTPYKALRMAVKGSKNGKVNFSVNGGANYTIPVTTSWVYIEIPLSDLGGPASITMLTFQESNNDGGNTVLFDDIGFVLK